MNSSKPPSPTTDQLRDWDRAHLWHPFTPQTDWNAGIPLVIERAEGVYLVDSEGNRYLDGVSSLWCNVHGHRHPTLDAAIRNQLEKVAHTTLLGATHPTAVELARRLVELAPSGLTRVFFSDDGATAVEIALKMAFQYWRQKAAPSRPVPSSSRSVARITAIRSAMSASAASSGFTRCSARYCFPRSARRAPFATAARSDCRDPSARPPAWRKSTTC